MATPTSRDACYLGVEIGGTKQQLCVGTGAGESLTRRTVQLGEVLLGRIRERTGAPAFAANRGRYAILPSALADDAVLVGALLLAARGGDVFL